MSEQASVQKEKLLQDMQTGWETLQAFIAQYSDEQLAGPTDAVGWTAKDHLIHLALWEGSMLAVMDQTPRWEYMQVPKQVWSTLDTGYDEVNAHIQQQHKSLGAVREQLANRHAAVVARVQSMPAEALQLPYVHYQPLAVDETAPLILYLSGNTFDHYDEHIPWMRSLIEAN
ncbi:MAG: ClbS/DfsB family four-helix bundle protein [Anaerolineales bacterium]|nr:MAG: ClbS/DfsB family four-helix bundle protein [Anaerolineales bacterium]